VTADDETFAGRFGGLAGVWMESVAVSMVHVWMFCFVAVAKVNGPMLWCW
jgi:hypothetical protein